MMQSHEQSVGNAAMHRWLIFWCSTVITMMHPRGASKMVEYAATNCAFTADMALHLTTVEHVTIEGESESKFLFGIFYPVGAVCSLALQTQPGHN